MKINRAKIAAGEHDELLKYSKKDFEQILQEKVLVKDGKVRMKLQLLTLPLPSYGEESSSLGQGIGDGQSTDGAEAIPFHGGGNDHAEFEQVEMDFDEFIRYYQKLLIEDLELPLLKNMTDGGNPKEEWVMNDFTRDGAPCDLDLDLTIEQALERAFTEHTTEITIDPKIDGWYGNDIPTKEQKNKALELYVLDVSGSVSGSLLGLIRKFTFCLNYYLDKMYASNVRRYIVFQDEAEEKTREEFFSCETKGGTHISSGLRKANEISQEYTDYDKYLFFFSDFDNSSADETDAGLMLKKAIETFTYLGMAHVTTSSDKSTEFSKLTRTYEKHYQNMAYTLLQSEDEIKDVIFHFLSYHDRTQRT